MEKTVNRVEGGEGGWKRDNLFTNHSHLFLIEFTIECLLNTQNIQNGGSITNAVRHGMHGIHFSTAKRLVRKRFVS